MSVLVLPLRAWPAAPGKRLTWVLLTSPSEAPRFRSEKKGKVNQGRTPYICSCCEHPLHSIFLWYTEMLDSNLCPVQQMFFFFPGYQSFSIFNAKENTTFVHVWPPQIWCLICAQYCHSSRDRKHLVRPVKIQPIVFSNT